MREASRRERGGTAGRDAYRHDNATMPQEWGAYQFPELRRAPGIVLDETIRDGLAKVLFKAVGERALRLLELWSGEGEPGVFVLAHVLQFLHVLAHLVQKILCVLVIGVDAALKLLLRWGCGGVEAGGSVCERVDDPVVGLSVHVVLPEDGARSSGAVKVSYDSFSHILGGLAAGDGVYGGNSCWTRSHIGRVGPVLCCFQGGKRTSLSTSLSLN